MTSAVDLLIEELYAGGDVDVTDPVRATLMVGALENVETSGLPAEDIATFIRVRQACQEILDAL